MDLLPLAILLFALLPCSDGLSQVEEAHCERTVRSWAEKELGVPQNQQKLKLRDLLFFLHIPRTGGRTYHQCFLKHLFGSDERCERSYDKLRVDISRPSCRLISTHDDYSILEKLPHDLTSVVTNLRQPVDRVLSAYEFSVEVAARFLKLSKTRFKVRRTNNPRPGSRLISTLDVWPWKYLVPFMRDDIFARRDAREAGLLKSAVEVPFNNSYDVESLVMPFHEFIHHPIAHELVHNGATFQVAGLTNNSFVEEAQEIRTCVVDYQHLGQYVLNVAKRRLDNMLYVGLTYHQKESATFFANVLRDQLSLQHKIRDPQRVTSKSSLSPISKKDQVQPAGYASHKRPSIDKRHLSTRNVRDSDLNSTVEKQMENPVDELLEAYDRCVADLRYAQENRRAVSLELLTPINFTKKERKLIPENVIAQVTHLNSLDADLYLHAEQLFSKQQHVLEHGLHHVLPAVTDEKQSLVLPVQMSNLEKQELSWQQRWSNLIAIALFVSLFGLIITFHFIRKKPVRERSTMLVLHPLFMKVHEKI